MLIDNLQYCNWSPKIFRQWREGGLDAVHVTIAYHEMFRETVLNMEQWNRWFEDYADLIMPAGSADCLLYTSPSPRDLSTSRMPSSA